MVATKAAEFAATVVFLNSDASKSIDHLHRISLELNSISRVFYYVSHQEVTANDWIHIHQQTHQTGLEALLNAFKSNKESAGDLLILSNGATISSKDATEVFSALNLAEKHGIVGVRSPRQGQGQVPARLPFEAEHLMPEELSIHSTDLFSLIKDFIPHYSTVKIVESPVIGISHNALRAVIARESISPFVKQWQEFCTVANNVGYSAIQLNNIFIELPKKQSHRLSHSQHEIVAVNGADQFAAVLEKHKTASRSLFIDLFNLDCLWNGTSRNAISFLSALQKRQKELNDFTQVVIGANPNIRDYFSLDQYGFIIKSSSELDERVFDTGFALAPLTHPRQLFRMNQLCARWVISHLDVIALRTLSLSETDLALYTTVRDSMIYSDRIISISNFTKNDLLSFFSENASAIAPKIRVCLEGADNSLLLHASNEHSVALPASHDDGYLLVVGNTYPHKQLDLALNALIELDIPVVVLGQKIEGRSLTIGLASGSLSEQNIADLYSKARVVVYPSTYEGYGLPVADAALFSKPIALFDTQIAREVTASLGVEKNTYFFSDFKELAPLVSQLYSSSQHELPNTSIRTLDDFNNDVVDRVLSVIDQEIDIENLNKRFDYIRSLEAYTSSTRLVAGPPKTNLFAKVKAPLKKILGR